MGNAPTSGSSQPPECVHRRRLPVEVRSTGVYADAALLSRPREKMRERGPTYPCRASADPVIAAVLEPDHAEAFIHFRSELRGRGSWQPALTPCIRLNPRSEDLLEFVR